MGKTIVRSLHFTLTKFQTKGQKSSKVHFYLGNLMTCMGEREISAVSGRLPDNPGELMAYMTMATSS